MNQNIPELQRWIASKFSRYPMRLCEPASATACFHELYEGRPVFGAVSLSAVPSKTFGFVSCADWSPGTNYEGCVFDGILDMLVSAHFHPIRGVRFTLDRIEWQADSVGVGYYLAARLATRKILRLEENIPNFESAKH